MSHPSTYSNDQRGNILQYPPKHKSLIGSYSWLSQPWSFPQMVPVRLEFYFIFFLFWNLFSFVMRRWRPAKRKSNRHASVKGGENRTYCFVFAWRRLSRSQVKLGKSWKVEDDIDFWNAERQQTMYECVFCIFFCSTEQWYVWGKMPVVIRFVFKFTVVVCMTVNERQVNTQTSSLIKVTDNDLLKLKGENRLSGSIKWMKEQTAVCWVIFIFCLPARAFCPNQSVMTVVFIWASSFLQKGT